MNIETERLRLREMDMNDLGALMEIMCEDETMYAYEGAFTPAEVEQWLGRQLDRYARYGFGLWAVELKDTGRVIGQCGITMQMWNGREVMEVGYLFNRAFWHHGYAAEAAIACRDAAFNMFGAEEVCSIIRTTNAASRRVAERMGMQIVDEWTKHYRGADMPHVLYSIKRGAVLK